MQEIRAKQAILMFSACQAPRADTVSRVFRELQFLLRSYFNFQTPAAQRTLALESLSADFTGKGSRQCDFSSRSRNKDLTSLYLTHLPSFKSLRPRSILLTSFLSFIDSEVSSSLLTKMQIDFTLYQEITHYEESYEVDCIPKSNPMITACLRLDEETLSTEKNAGTQNEDLRLWFMAVRVLDAVLGGAGCSTLRRIALFYLIRVRTK